MQGMDLGVRRRGKAEMSGYFVMLIFFGLETIGGGVAMEKVGIYETEAACVAAANQAGIEPMPKNARQGPYFVCVGTNDFYGAE